jgi:hypothetical protein
MGMGTITAMDMNTTMNTTVNTTMHSTKHTATATIILMYANKVAASLAVCLA